MATPIFLIGYMGCGKTTLGNALANAAEITFTDLDAEIEKDTGLSVGDIFSTFGEQHFRKLEADKIRELARTDDSAPQKIIACGGGTPCNSDNMEFMLRNGTVIWLKADREITLKRLIQFQATRPRIKGLSEQQLAQFIDSDLEKRTPSYSKAHVTFDSSRLDTRQQVDQTTLRFIKQFNLKPLTK